MAFASIPVSAFGQGVPLVPRSAAYSLFPLRVRASVGKQGVPPKAALVAL